MAIKSFIVQAPVVKVDLFQKIHSLQQQQQQQQHYQLPGLQQQQQPHQQQKPGVTVTTLFSLMMRANKLECFS
jgi:hypothetical protein